jgi:hypothetical protein
MLARYKKSSAKYQIRIDDGEYFIHIWNLCKLIQNNNNTLIKNIYIDNKKIIDTSTLDKTKSIVDSHDNIFIYLGTTIPTIIKNDIYYFCIKTLLMFNKNIFKEKSLDLNNIHIYQKNKYISHTSLFYYANICKTKTPFIKWIINNVSQNITDELNFKNKEIDTDSKLNNIINLDKYEESYCVYFFKIRYNTYKYGDTYSIKNRMRSHSSTFDRIDNMKIYKFEDFRQMKDMANKFKDLTKELKINYKDSEDRTELFKTNNKYSIDTVLEKADELYNIINIPPIGLKETRIVFKLIEKLIINYGYEQSLNIIKEDFTEEDVKYIKEKIFKQNNNIDSFTKKIKHYHISKKLQKFCINCECDKCIKCERNKSDNNQYCLHCKCKSCIAIKNKK